VSITRLQQARQMYATGQRVAKTLDGSRPGYRGDDAYGSSSRSSQATSSRAATSSTNSSAPGGDSGQETRGDGPSSSDRDNNTREDNNPFNTAPPQIATNLDVREQYAVNNPTTLGAPIAPPTVSPFFENNRKDNYIDAFNLSNSTYKPVNIPPFIPGSTLINTAGNFLGNLGYKKNTQFFADNVAGKYGYGYGIDAYKEYMKNRMTGNVNAYGRPLTEGELRLRDGDNPPGDQQNMVGIETIGGNLIDDATENTTTDDELILRFLGADSTLDPAAAGLASTDELRAMLLERARNLYT